MRHQSRSEDLLVGAALLNDDGVDRDALTPLTEVPRLAFMPRPGGKLIHISTVFRWAQRGLRGLKLRTVQVGGRRCTTARWLCEFFENLAAD